MLRIPGAGALNKNHLLGNFSVGGSSHLTLSGSGRSEESFNLKSVNNIFILTISVLADPRFIHEVVPRGNNDSSHIFFHKRLFLIKINGPHRAGLDADAAPGFGKIKTVFFVNDRLVRHGLRKQSINSLSLAQKRMKLRWYFHWTFFYALATTCAFIPVHKGGFSPDPGLEVTQISRDIFQF